MRLSPLIPLLFLAPAGLSAGPQTASGPVAEIVTFRLNPGVEADDVIAAGAGTMAALDRYQSITARYLTVDEDGLWTDIVIWSDLATALKAADEVMAHPDFAPFGAMIDPASVTLRHAAIGWQMIDAARN